MPWISLPQRRFGGFGFALTEATRPTLPCSSTARIAIQPFDLSGIASECTKPGGFGCGAPCSGLASAKLDSSIFCFAVTSS